MSPLRSADVRVLFIPSSCGGLLLFLVSSRPRCHFGSNARVIESRADYRHLFAYYQQNRLSEASPLDYGLSACAMISI